VIIHTLESFAGQAGHVNDSEWRKREGLKPLPYSKFKENHDNFIKSYEEWWKDFRKRSTFNTGLGLYRFTIYNRTSFCGCVEHGIW
jgi:hypothetical protein